VAGTPPGPGGFRHEPVMVEEVLELLAPRPGQTLIDATVGGGGHAERLLERIAPHGRLVGLDVDDEALEAAASRLGRFGDRVALVRSSFRRLDTVLDELGIAEVDGILMDLGVSSRQLDAPERGFRFAEETAERTPLDMRMDRRLPAAGADLLARADAEQIADWLRRYADLPGARRLARTLVERRRRAPLRTARDLREAVEAAGVGRRRRHHPATLVFQALRIAVNDEIAALEEGLGKAIAALRPGGRLAVLAYHSAEDRVAKQRLREESRGRTGPPGLPEALVGRPARLRVLTPRPRRPEPAEVARNPRARSARLRAAERVEASE